MKQNFLHKIDKTAQSQSWFTRQAALLFCLAVGILLLTLLIGFDYLGRFTDPGLRWLATSCLLGGIGFVAWKHRNGLLQARPSRLAIAKRIEEQHHELGSRLSSAVEFYDQEIDDPAAGSAELRRAVVLQTDEQSNEVDFLSVVDKQSAKRATRNAILSTLLLVGFTVAQPAAVATGFMRLMAPWQALPWPREQMLSLVDPPSQITRGEDFELIAVDANNRLPNDLLAEFRYPSSSRQTDRQPMQLVGNQGIILRAGVTESLEYRVVGGDDHTMPWLPLAVVDPPEIGQLNITIKPPAYSGLPETSSMALVRVLAGSELRATAQSDKPLAAAWLELPANVRFEAELSETVDANEKTSATTSHNTIRATTPSWQAEVAANQSGRPTWQFVFESPAGSIGKSLPQPFEVVLDTPPKLSWQQPAGDLFVTPHALVTLEIDVKDNLAIARSWVTVKSVSTLAKVDSDSDSANTNETPTTEIAIYNAGQTPPVKESLNNPEQLSLKHDWDLQKQNYQAGTRLDLVVYAEDFLPQQGKVSLPRRVFLITPEEFEARLAKKQSLLLEEIQQAVDRQRSSKEIAESVLVDAQSGQPLSRSSLDRLATSEFEQRQAMQRVEAPRSGAARQARDLADEVARNRLDNPELEKQLTEAASRLEATGKNAMAKAKQSLAKARRAATRESQAEAADALNESIKEQAAATEELEQVAASLTGWANFQRLAEEVAKLEQKQAKLAERTAKLAVEAAVRNPMRITENQAEQRKLLGEQAEASRRFQQLQEMMENLLQQPTGEKRSESQNAVADAEQEASERDIAGGLREASRQLARNQLGRAAEQQKQSANDLREMLSTLQRRSERDLNELMRQLSQAKQQLAKLESQAKREKSRSQPRASQQEKIAKEASRLARKLDRLTAPQASQSTSQASQSLQSKSQEQQTASQQQKQQGQEQDQPKDQQQNQQTGQQQTGQSKPSEGKQGQPKKNQTDKEKLAQAEQELAKAQKQIEQRIEELQGEQAERLLDKLEKELPRFITQQETLLAQTNQLNGSAVPGRDKQSADLGVEESELVEELSEFAAGLSPKPVFEFALNRATETMQQAAAGLKRFDLGRTTQRAEFIGLERLRHIEQVLKNHREEKEEQKQQQKESQGGGQQGDPPPPLPFEVAELKMLRLMQLELISQTERFEADEMQEQQDLARGRIEASTTDWQAVGQEIREAQKRLSELAFEIANRKTEK